MRGESHNKTANEYATVVNQRVKCKVLLLLFSAAIDTHDGSASAQKLAQKFDVVEMRRERILLKNMYRETSAGEHALNA